MARTARNSKVDTRSARTHLVFNKSGYWVALARGHSFGYRKGAKGGRWVARLIIDGKRQETIIGIADDVLDADGVTILNYSQAQEAARQWFTSAARLEHGDHIARGDYTVTHAVQDYLAHYKAEGKGYDFTKSSIDAHILSHPLSKIPLAKLTSQKIEQWLHALADSPARIRTPASATTQKTKPLDDSAETKRRRRASANRNFTILKAALNHAWKHGKVAHDMPWRKVKPFRSVDAPVVRYLKDAECKRLVNACTDDLRQIAKAALFTGCRYGELARLTAADFNPDAGTLTIRTSKNGKPRHVTLTDEAQHFFHSATAGKQSQQLIFTHANGTAWGKSHQSRALAEACEAAKITPAVSFHILRHTHGSILAMRGVPLPVIAQQLGHADSRMTEKHYAHLSPSYVADTIRENFPTLGFRSERAIIPLQVATKSKR